jgi:endonuclease-3
MRVAGRPMMVRKTLTKLERVLDQLETLFGRPPRLRTTDPLGMILLENVAYLLSDERRAAAFAALERRVGLTPSKILSAPQEVLLEVARMGGMRPETRVERLRFIAQVAEMDFQGDLRRALKLPPKQARKALRMFPNIGVPGAEKILLFSKTEPVLALESNGLRVLVRLGYGRAHKNYSTEYRSAQEAASRELPEECAPRIRAFQLLRRHGQEICRRAGPLCTSCPLTRVCAFYQTQNRSSTGRI